MLQDTMKVEDECTEMFPDAAKRVERFEAIMKDDSVTVPNRIEYARRIIEEVSRCLAPYGSRMNKLYMLYCQLEFHNPKKRHSTHLWQRKQAVIDELHAIDRTLAREHLERDHYVTYLRDFIHEEYQRVISTLPPVRLFGF